MCDLQKARKVRKETRRFETRDEKEALEYYKMMKAGRKRKAEEEEGESGEEEEGAAEGKEGNVRDEDMEGTEEKRGITYQVSNFFNLFWSQFVKTNATFRSASTDLDHADQNVAFVSTNSLQSKLKKFLSI